LVPVPGTVPGTQELLPWYQVLVPGNNNNDQMTLVNAVSSKSCCTKEFFWQAHTIHVSYLVQGKIIVESILYQVQYLASNYYAGHLSTRYLVLVLLCMVGCHPIAMCHHMAM